MTLKIEFPDEKTAALAAKAGTQGLCAEQYARQVLEHDLESEPQAPLEQPLRTAADIILSSSSQHAHYIYGFPNEASEDCYGNY
jgi:plasmid stability protein